MSDRQELVTLTHPLESPTRKFNTLFFCQRDVFFMMHKEFCNSDADLFGGFAGRHNYSQSLFFSDLVYITTILYAIVWVCKFLLTRYKE